MKIKYYLRGFGAGIIMTTLIFAIVNLFTGLGNANGIGSGNAEQTTSSVLAYTRQEQTTAETTAAQADNSTQADNAAQTVSGGAAAEATTATDSDSNGTNATDGAGNVITVAGNATQPATVKAGQVVNIEIKDIKYMYEVSDMLYSKGLITDVAGFNSYMTFNGYDVRLREGSYEIKAGASFEEIAKIITKS